MIFQWRVCTDQNLARQYGLLQDNLVLIVLCSLNVLSWLRQLNRWQPPQLYSRRKLGHVKFRWKWRKGFGPDLSEIWLNVDQPNQSTISLNLGRSVLSSISRLVAIFSTWKYIHSPWIIIFDGQKNLNQLRFNQNRWYVQYMLHHACHFRYLNWSHFFLFFLHCLKALSTLYESLISLHGYMVRRVLEMLV